MFFSKTESYSNTVKKDKIISQSISPNEIVKAGQAFSVVVSKGKAVYVPYFEGWEKEEIRKWASENSVEIEFISRYNDSKSGTIVYQEPGAGSIVTDTVKVTISKGNPELDANTLEALQKEIDSLNLRENGDAGLSIGTITYVADDEVQAGRIIKPIKAVTGQPVNITISRGKEYLLDTLPQPRTGILMTWEYIQANPQDVKEDEMKYIFDKYELEISGKSINLNYEFVYESGKEANGDVVGNLKKIYRSDGVALKNGTYITQDVKITVVVCDSLSD